MLNWLDHRTIYLIFDSEWVSPVQVVPKKTSITMIRNDKNELVPTRVQSRWCVCITYKKLNAATWEDNFFPPFLKMLERLAGYSFCFVLDGYSDYA